MVCEQLQNYLIYSVNVTIMRKAYRCIYTLLYIIKTGENIIYGKVKSISQTQRHRNLHKTLWNRCPWCHGTGSFLLPADRHDHQHTWNTVSYFISDHCCGNCKRHPVYRRLSGICNKSGPAMAVAIGYALHCPPLVLFSLITVGFASNALGGAGGPLAVLFVAIFASEIGKAVSKETKIDILMHSTCHDRCRCCPVRVVGSGTWKCSDESGKYYYVGNQPAAVPDGNPCFCICGYCTDTSYLICRNLCCAWPYRTCRSCCSRLLCTNGRFRSNVLPRKQMGWSCFSGNRNIHAPDGKYRKKSTHLDCTDPLLLHPPDLLQPVCSNFR